MTEAELIKCLSERFYSDFADTVARRVRDAGAVGLLYEVVTSRCEGLPRAVGHKVAFRGAYVLEKIYFDAPDSFMPYAGLFAGRISRPAPIPAPGAISQRSWPTCWGVSRPRCGIWSGLPSCRPVGGRSGGKVAVKIWAVEVLKHCRQRVGWVRRCGTTLWRRWRTTQRRGSKCGCAKAGRNPAGRESGFAHDMGKSPAGNKSPPTFGGLYMLQALPTRVPCSSVFRFPTVPAFPDSFVPAFLCFSLLVFPGWCAGQFGYSSPPAPGTGFPPSASVAGMPGRSSSPAASSVRAECCFLVCRRAVLRSRSPTRMMLSLPVQSRL